MLTAVLMLSAEEGTEGSGQGGRCCTTGVTARSCLARDLNVGPNWANLMVQCRDCHSALHFAIANIGPDSLDTAKGLSSVLKLAS